jgi:hypothetical protein
MTKLYRHKGHQYREAGPLRGKSGEDLRRALEGNFIIQGGDGWITLDDPDPVHIAVVYAVDGYGPHEAAIFVDQNRYHASGDTALQGAYEILEQYWWENYSGHYDELVKDYGEQEVQDYGMFTEHFEGIIWELSAQEAADAIRGTDADLFIEISEPEPDEY